MLLRSKVNFSQRIGSFFFLCLVYQLAISQAHAAYYWSPLERRGNSPLSDGKSCWEEFRDSRRLCREVFLGGDDFDACAYVACRDVAANNYSECSGPDIAPLVFPEVPGCD